MKTRKIITIKCFLLIISSLLIFSCSEDGSNNSLLPLLFIGGGTTEWTHQAYLKAPNNGGAGVGWNDYFGYSVAISGDTIAVGATREDSNTTAIINGSDLSGANDSGTDNGAVYVFIRSGATWAHQAYLKAPNNGGAGVGNNDQFGTAVAIDGDTIAVAACYEDSATTAIINGSDLSGANDSGTDNGAVYVFTRSGTTWSHQAYLKAPNSAANDWLGMNTISIDNDTIVVGSFCENSTTTAIINGADLSGADNLGNANGAAYVFFRSGTTWSHQAYLKSPNNEVNDRFGEWVGISGDTIAVGAIYEDSSTTAIINGSDLSGTDDAGNNNGAVYVFTRSGAIWSHQAYLKAPNGADSDQFGRTVAIDGNTIAVCAVSENSTTTAIINGSDLGTANNAGNVNGAVYVFTRSGTAWTHQSYLKAPNNGGAGVGNLDFFGISLAISGDTIVAGTYNEDSTTTAIINGNDLDLTNDDGNGNGAVYVFTRSGTAWSHQAYLKAPNNGGAGVGNDNNFGRSLGISGNSIVVGAPGERSETAAIINGADLSGVNNDGGGNGAAYVFTR